MKMKKIKIINYVLFAWLIPLNGFWHHVDINVYVLDLIVAKFIKMIKLKVVQFARKKL